MVSPIETAHTILATAKEASIVARGQWTAEDRNYDDLRRHTRFSGPLVIYADDDCETHPLADCSCNHSCRDEDDAAAIAAHIVAGQPTSIAPLAENYLAAISALDALDKGEVIALKPFYVCQHCGNTVEGEAPDKCPICGRPKKMFKRID